MIDMPQGDSTKVSTRSKIMGWGGAIFGILLVQVIFGWKNGLVGIAWSVGPIIVALLSCLAFWLFGRFLSDKMNWPIQTLILAVAAIIVVSTTLSILIMFTAQGPSQEFGDFAPGKPGFIIVLFISPFLIALGLLARSR